jgi:hypothetical protein
VAQLDKGQKIPRILKQGDDSVGFEGALSRVYVNIGHAWPEWQKHFRPLVGGPFPGNPGLASQSPITVKEMQMNSASWNWSEDRSHALAVYFITYAKPLLLKDAPGGAAFLTTDQNVLNRGKVVFAENCAACHSSRQPAVEPFDANGAITDEAKNWFRGEVMKPDLFTDNFLSRRAPPPGHADRHQLDARRCDQCDAQPHLGQLLVRDLQEPCPDHPAVRSRQSVFADRQEQDHHRVERTRLLPSAVADQPLVERAVPAQQHGRHRSDEWSKPGDVSVAARMKAFQDGIEKMLWIQPRGKLIWKTSKKSYINLPLPISPTCCRTRSSGIRSSSSRGRRA